MRLPWPHRDGDAAPFEPASEPVSAPVPSPESTERLAERLQHEIEDLRSELTDDLLLTLILLGEDEVDGAVGLLDDGSDRLRRFQDRVEGAVADAAVEREAEAVVVAAGAPGQEPAETRGSAFRIRAFASVAAAVLAAVVALVSVEPSDGPSMVAARTSSPAPASDLAVTTTERAVNRTSEGSSSTAREDDEVSPTATTPSDRLQALRAIGDQGGVLARLGSEPRRSAVAALFGVDRLLDQVIADARDLLPSETVESVAETLSEIELPLEEPSAEPEAEPRPEPRPSTEEAPSEQPSDGTSTADEPTDDGTEDGTGGSEEPSEDASSDESPEDDGSEDGWDDPGTLPGDASGSWSAPGVQDGGLL